STALNELGGSGEAQARSFSITRTAFPRTATISSLAWIALSIGRDLPHLGRRHVAEDIAVPMHSAALEGRIGKELGRAPGKTHTGIGYDQPNAVEAAFPEMCEECAPASLVLLGAFTDAEYLRITLIVRRNARQIHLDQRFLHRALAPPVTFDNCRLERLLAKLRYLQPNFTGLGLQLAFVVAGSGVTARFAAFVMLRMAKPICPRHPAA